MGFVDRGGGRESKGSSLRRSSKNPGTAVAKGKSAPKNTSAATAPATRVGPALPAVWQPFRDVDVRCVANAEGEKDNNNKEEATTKVTSELVNALRALRTDQATHKGHIRRVQVDAAVSLLSRSLQDDVQGLMRRACEEGKLRALLCWSRELERQASLLDYCRSHNKLYAQSLTTESTTTSGNATHEKKKAVHFAVANAEEEDNDTKKKCDNGGSADNSAEEGCLLYCLVGIHVGNIVRTHRKIQEQWIEDIAVLARQPEVVGIVSGINFARDPATHYAQEWLLKECWRIAAELHLPLVIFVEANVTENTAGEVEGSDESGADRVAEVLRELMTHTAAPQADDNNDNEVDGEKKEVLSPTAVVLHNGLRVLSHSTALRDLVRRQRVSATPPFYVLTSAEDIEYVMQRESGQKTTVTLLPSLCEESVTASKTYIVSLTQLLLGTNSPWGTPQNIDDAYLRTQRNEPANFPWVLRTLYEAMQHGADTETPSQAATSESKTVLTSEDVADVVLCNFLRVFFAHSEASNNTSKDQEGRGEAASSHLTARPSAMKFIAPNLRVTEDASSEDNTRLAKPFVITHADPIDDVEHAVQSHLHAKVEDAEWHALLAQAAREREAIEAERAAREHDAALAPKPEKHRQKKVNVKANNRSNFTHFRNKDFTPRLTRAEKAAAGNTQPHSPSESDNEEVEMESETAMTNTMKPKAKPKKRRETRTTTHQPQGNASSSSSSSSSSSDSDSEDDEGKEAGMQPSRSQRKKMQRRRKNKGQPQAE